MTKESAWHFQATQVGKPWSSSLSYDIGADDNENIALVHPAEDGDAVTKARARLLTASPVMLKVLVFLSERDSYARQHVEDAMAEADIQWDFLKGDVK